MSRTDFSPMGETARGEIDPAWLPETTGTPVWIWRSRDGLERFAPYAGADELVEIAASVGWSLAPDPGCGVALVNVWGERLTAGEAFGRASSGTRGLRVRSVERIETPDGPGFVVRERGRAGSPKR